MAAPRGNFQNRRTAEMAPALVLAGGRPRLLDEWQEVSSLWDAVRLGVDAAAGRHGQFALTGSVKLERLAEMIVRGGWPTVLGMPLNRAMLLPRECIRAVDAQDIDIKTVNVYLDVLRRPCPAPPPSA